MVHVIRGGRVHVKFTLRPAENRCTTGLGSGTFAVYVYRVVVILDVCICVQLDIFTWPCAVLVCSKDGQQPRYMYTILLICSHHAICLFYACSILYPYAAHVVHKPLYSI